MPRHCKVLLQPVAQELHCSIPVASVDMAYGKVGNCTKLQCTLYLQAIAKSSSSPLHRNCIAASLFDGTLGHWWWLKGNVGSGMKLQCILYFQPIALELLCSRKTTMFGLCPFMELCKGRNRVKACQHDL